MKFIVIEGDNGTGKDSLAQIFEKKGMLIVTYLPEVIEKEKVHDSNIYSCVELYDGTIASGGGDTLIKLWCD